MEGPKKKGMDRAADRRKHLDEKLKTLRDRESMMGRVQEDRRSGVAVAPIDLSSFLQAAEKASKSPQPVRPSDIARRGPAGTVSGSSATHSAATARLSTSYAPLSSHRGPGAGSAPRGAAAAAVAAAASSATSSPSKPYEPSASSRASAAAAAAAIAARTPPPRSDLTGLPSTAVPATASNTSLAAQPSIPPPQTSSPPRPDRACPPPRPVRPLSMRVQGGRLTLDEFPDEQTPSMARIPEKSSTTSTTTTTPSSSPLPLPSSSEPAVAKQASPPTQLSTGGMAPDGERPICELGVDCKSVDPDHWISHSHTARKWTTVVPGQLSPASRPSPSSPGWASASKSSGGSDSSGESSPEPLEHAPAGSRLSLRMRFLSLKKSPRESPVSPPSSATSPSSEAEAAAADGGRRRTWRSKAHQYENLEELRKSYSSQDKIAAADSSGDLDTSAEHVLGTDSRGMVLRELLQTERDYVRDLNLVMEFFMEPMFSSGIITFAETKKIFSNIRELHSVNSDLLEHLERAILGAASEETENETVGQAFLDIIPYFRLYTVYLGNQDVSNATLAELGRSSSRFQTFMLYTQLRPECRNLDLKSFLIKPFQRICKYPLLLKELIKYSSPSDPDYENLKSALEQIRESVQFMDSKKKGLERTTKMMEIQARVPGLKNLLQPSRKFLAEGNIVEPSAAADNTWTPVSHYLLFNDLLVDCSRPGGGGNARLQGGASSSSASLAGSTSSKRASVHSPLPLSPSSNSGSMIAGMGGDEPELVVRNEYELYAMHVSVLEGSPTIIKVHSSTLPKPLFLLPPNEAVAKKAVAKIEKLQKRKKSLQSYRRYMEIYALQSRAKGASTMQLTLDEFIKEFGI